MNRYQVRTLALFLALSMSVVSAAVAGSLLLERSAAERYTRKMADLWSKDLADAFATKDWLQVKKISQTLSSEQPSFLIVRTDDAVVYAQGASGVQPTNCWLAFDQAIERYGISLGRIEVCFSAAQLLSNVAKRPSALPLAAAGSFIFALLTTIPLIRYRASLRRTLCVLAQWADAPIAQVESHGDSVVAEVVRQVEKGAKRELEAERILSKAQSAEALTTLASQVAHDIRSPLAALNLALKTDPMSADSRNLMVNATARIHAIADDLLQSKRAAHNVAQMVCITKVIEDIVAEKQAVSNELRGVRILVDIPPSLAFVTGNSSDVARVVSNLVNNAVEAIKNAQGTVRVSMHTDTSNVHVRVEDDGCGIPEHVLKKLGKESVTFGKRAGNGLGLSHAFGLARSMSGNLDIKSVYGRGTHIVLTLPLAVA